MNLLSEIIAQKRQRVETAKGLVSADAVRLIARQARDTASPHALVNALTAVDDSRNKIIAEFKRRSPSKGEIRRDADPAHIAKAYESGGAAAVSVLTEEDYFDGSLDDLRAIRQVTSLPVLRKDFIFEEYQVYESAAAGADALLLIAAALNDETIGRLRRITEEELGMDALVEVHTREEMERASHSGAQLIGVNNRDLGTFAVSTATSTQLFDFAPGNAILISESGLDPEEVRKLRTVGYKGFLVGETLMRADDPQEALRGFTEKR
jgi:indole-3-glycerol phosphate synthase